MRIIRGFFFFILTNIAIIALMSVIVSVFKIDIYYLKPYGLNLKSLAIFSLLFGMIGSFFSLFISRWMAKKIYNIKVFTQPKSTEESRIYNVISRIAQQHNMTLPEIGIYHSSEVNAFATGWNKNHSLVACSSGLVEAMNEDELEGVLAHEMAHIINGDMVIMTLLQGVMNAFVIFLSRLAAYGVEMFLSRGNENTGRTIGGFSYFLLSIFFQIIFGMIAGIILMFFSRRREFRADRGSAEMVGKSKMIQALQKLKQLQDRIDTTHASIATAKISNRPSKFSRIFSSHPPLQKRIEALQGLSIH